MNTETLFIGVGNSLRRDDGVGAYIVNALQQRLGAGNDDLYSYTESSGEGSGLMESWKGFDNVVIFDALMMQGEPGRVVKLDANTQVFPSDYFRYSSHAFSLAEAVEMARVLDSLPKSLIVYGVEGEDFGFGEGLSPSVEASAQAVVDGVYK